MPLFDGIDFEVTPNPNCTPNRPDGYGLMVQLQQLSSDTHVTLKYRSDADEEIKSLSGYIEEGGVLSGIACIARSLDSAKFFATPRGVDTIGLAKWDGESREDIGIILDLEISSLPTEEVPVTDAGPETPPDMVGSYGFLDIESEERRDSFAIEPSGLQERDHRLTGLFTKEPDELDRTEVTVQMTGCPPRRLKFIDESGDDTQ
ncbi:hypothetical protein [Haloarcula laminariae]|uniref:hypothetical protein n=1 Tax=Haloarcula laminariae TaxID=2961577 RepID=UPI002404975F|nr:hypothetical protein [Halomicroarcula sp. FL173]